MVFTISITEMRNSKKFIFLLFLSILSFVGWNSITPKETDLIRSPLHKENGTNQQATSISTSSTSLDENVLNNYLNREYIKNWNFTPYGRLKFMMAREHCRKKQEKNEKAGKFSGIIVGVKKCGTSSLQLFLTAHPQIKFQRMYAGEGHYFTIGCFALSKEECLSQTNIFKYFYSAQKESADDFIFEKSPNYFNTLRIAEIIKLYNKNIKIIVITCEPAARAYSDYLHLRTVLAKQKARLSWIKPPLLSLLAT